ncbi:hypothetical protein [Acidianus sp. HS-5]|uniref:hypothetical protein n=1 Tax=Acidianus sp. HS-5 TaxID=2886040 RepID=UPI001F1784A2|nr:hypothetical protein [Acidianus sp. HS-5]BDC17527.1 hypothetical protein HS5_04170 [Acidianus sp. HS-5]
MEKPSRFELHENSKQYLLDISQYGRDELLRLLIQGIFITVCINGVTLIICHPPREKFIFYQSRSIRGRLIKEAGLGVLKVDSMEKINLGDCKRGITEEEIDLLISWTGLWKAKILYFRVAGLQKKLKIMLNDEIKVEEVHE